jgi:hypothetical protein
MRWIAFLLILDTNGSLAPNTLQDALLQKLMSQGMVSEKKLVKREIAGAWRKP